MSNAKKLFAISVTALTVLSMVGFAPMGAKAASAGSLIKMAGNSAVYYFDGTKRYVFPQENVYFSWYKDFSGVQTVSQSELQSYPIGGNVTMRPGTWMVKITTDPKVYAVTPGGVLHHLDSEARAVTLYGSNWNKMIKDVSDAFFVNYTTGTAISSNVHPDGTVIQVGTQYYYVMGGVKRPFASAAALAANNINTAFAVSTSLTYTDGSSITGAETALTNVAGSSSTTTTSAAGLTVSAGAMTASTSLPFDANSVKIGVWNFAAGSEGAVTLNSVTFKRSGVGSVNDISAAYIYDGANRLTSGRTFNSSTNEVTFTLNLNIPAGSTKALSLLVSIAASGTASAGDEHIFSVEAASKVSSNAASVNGVFPVASNKHSIAGTSAGTVTVTDQSGSLSNPRVGDRGAKVSMFKLSATTEDAYLNQITLTQGGSIANTAMSNFILKQNSVTVATASAIASNDRLDLIFSPSFKIEKGNDRTFELYADVDGRPTTDTIQFYLDETSDIMATGGTFGVGMKITNSNFTSAVATTLTLQGGEFTLSFDGPSSSNISNVSNDVVLWKATVYSANAVEVRNWRFGIEDLTAADVDLCDATATCAVQDLKLWNLDNNTVIAGPYDFTPANGLGDETETPATTPLYFSFTDDYTFNAGQTMHIGLSADIKNNPASSQLALQVRMGNGTNSFTANDIKNTNSNTYLSVTTGIVPSTEIVGQTMTVVAGGLTVTTAASPTAHTLIKGSAADAAGGFNFTAGAGASVKVNSVQVKVQTDDDVSGWGDDGVSPSNLILSAKLMDGTTQVGLSKSFTVASNIGTATFDNLNWTIPASQTKRLDVVITTNSAATLASSTNDGLRVFLAAGAVSAVDAEGNALTGNIPSAEQDGPTITVKASGSLTATLAPTPTNPSASLIAGGTTDKVMAAFKFEAIDESFLVKKFHLITNTAANTARLATAKVRYTKQVGGTETRTIGLSGTSTDNAIDISDMPMYVAQNGSAILEVLGDAATFTVLDGSEAAKTLSFTLKGSDAATNQATGVASNQSVTNYGSNAAGNEHLFVRTVLTAAAGSGTPTNTARTRQAGQKVASYNLSASSSSNAFIRGSLKAADSSATGWAVLGTTPTVAASTAQAVSGTSSILFTEDASAATSDGVYFNFGDTTSLAKYKRASMWIRNSAAIAAGDIKLFTNDLGSLATPTNDQSIGAVATTGVWAYVDVALGVTATGDQYAGLYIAANAATYNSATIYIDDFRFYTDSINVDISGNLNATAPAGLLFTLKDSGGTVRAHGAYAGSTTVGTVKLVAGTGSDVAVVTTASGIEISTSALALDLETNTSSLMLADTTANESLSVSIDTGTTTSAGDVSWYDNSDTAGGNDVAAITSLNPLSTTITFGNTY